MYSTMHWGIASIIAQGPCSKKQHGGIHIVLYKSYRKLSERLQSKNITGNMKGEGLVQGGIIIFDKAGVAAYREETGSEIPIRDILLAIRAVRDEDDVGGQLKE